mgnify:FL=1
MAQANYYGPLYNAIEARGRLSPLGAPAAIKPYEKKKSFGDKMAGAFGDMIDQSMESRDAQEKEQVAQLEMEMKGLNKIFEGGEFRTFEGADPMQQAEKWHWNPSYKGDKSITPDITLIDRFFAVKGQLGQLKGQKQYKDRKPSAFDYQFTETAKPASTGGFGKAFRSIMGI